MLDEGSGKLVDNVLSHDDILNENITRQWSLDVESCQRADGIPADIEYIEQRRQTNREVDAIYFLSAKPHIVDCIMADFDRRRYRRSNLIWTSCKPLRLSRSSLLADKLSKCRIQLSETDWISPRLRESK